MSKKQDPSKSYAAFLYTVSYDPDFLQTHFNVPEEAVEQIRISHDQVMDNPATAARGLIALIEKYPAVPQLKNLLGAAYQLSGNDKKAAEVNDKIIHKHPDYLFGKLNKAYQYLAEGNPEKIPALLGKWMELNGLYPRRDEFHISEVMAFNKLTCMYYMAVNNIEAAKSHLVGMEKFDRDHPDAVFVRQKLFGNMN